MEQLVPVQCSQNQGILNQAPCSVLCFGWLPRDITRSSPGRDSLGSGSCRQPTGKYNLNMHSRIGGLLINCNLSGSKNGGTNGAMQSLQSIVSLFCPNEKMFQTIADVGRSRPAMPNGLIVTAKQNHREERPLLATGSVWQTASLHSEYCSLGI